MLKRHHRCLFCFPQTASETVFTKNQPRQVAQFACGTLSTFGKILAFSNPFHEHLRATSHRFSYKRYGNGV
jgi:hypothetical protein